MNKVHVFLAQMIEHLPEVIEPAVVADPGDARNLVLRIQDLEDAFVRVGLRGLANSSDAVFVPLVDPL